MKKRNFGFTLIELLVVIVIIGILATISTATFKSYFGKARDAERQSAVQNIALMIKVDGADDWTNTKYIYTFTELDTLMSANDFRVPAGKNAICYFLGMLGGTDAGIGDDNEFVIATWGESTSTEETGEPGVLMDGTTLAMDAISGVAESGFACSGTDSGVFGEAFDDLEGTDETYLYINDGGCIVGGGGAGPAEVCPSADD